MWLQNLSLLKVPSFATGSLTTFLAAIITSNALRTLLDGPAGLTLCWELHEVLHIHVLIEKSDKFADLCCNHDGLELAGLATTNEPSVGLLSLSVEETPNPVSPPAFHL